MGHPVEFHYLCRSKSIHCASMCMMNANCEAHYLDSSQCLETGAAALVGSMKDSPDSRVVKISSSVYSANRGAISRFGIWIEI